jgi:ribosomal protein L29
MAKVNKHDLKKLNESDLNARLMEINQEIMKLRSQVASGARLENPGLVTSLKKNRARILTLFNQKKGEQKKR